MTSRTVKSHLLLKKALIFGILFLALSTGARDVDAGEPDQTLLSHFLYFGDTSGRYLSSTEHLFPKTLSPHELATAIIDALIQGPPQGLTRTLPRETRLNALFIDDNGSAYVDLDDTITNQLPGGAESELLAIFSIANSLALNIPEIEQVRFLIQGMDARTLTGHMDLNQLFKANMLIIR